MHLRYGAHSRYRWPKNFKTEGYPSDYSYYSMSGAIYSTTATSNSDGKWPEIQPEILPNFESQFELPKLEIDQILPNHQLELEELMRIHTLFAGDGGRRKEIEVVEIQAKIGSFLADSGGAGPR
ncbi:hypothetical protein L3X38_012044 [Prunus dulcis]|uniref:Uncharacterized protein n=1 Tax=Prunus dulcis TaxID=3755 RepID=A0AAD4ZEV1_PRUDU|nr:hypothetical protein L3X38_012044 [Prunus dulcis]